MRSKLSIPDCIFNLEDIAQRVVSRRIYANIVAIVMHRSHNRMKPARHRIPPNLFLNISPSVPNRCTKLFCHYLIRPPSRSINFLLQHPTTQVPHILLVQLAAFLKTARHFPSLSIPPHFPDQSHPVRQFNRPHNRVRVANHSRRRSLNPKFVQTNAWDHSPSCRHTLSSAAMRPVEPVLHSLTVGGAALPIVVDPPFSHSSCGRTSAAAHE